MAGQARWKVKPKKFETVQKDGWWVKKSSTTPKGGTVSTKRTFMPPREWVGSDGMVGGYKSEPRLDVTKWESMQDPETKRWWARPRTDLTGLDTQQQADIKQFDAGTAATQSRIQAAYDEFARWSQENAQQGGAQLNSLAGLMGQGYGEADPTGRVLGTAARQQAVGNVAPTIASLNRAPTLAKEAGLTNVTAWLAERGKTRTETIKDYRQSAAENALEARDQELKYLNESTKNDISVAKAKTDDENKDADRAQKLAIEEARLRQKAEEAAAKGREREAKRLEDQANAKAKAKAKLRPSSTDLRAWTKRARSMWEGIPTGGKDANGLPLKNFYSAAEILRELKAGGASDAKAREIVQAITGKDMRRGYGTGADRAAQLGGSPAGYG